MFQLLFDNIWTVLFCAIIISIFAILLTYILIFVRIRTNPMYNKVPTTPLYNPFFGVILYYLRRQCRILSILKEDTYGPISLSFVDWGRARLNIGDPKWIKYISNSKNFQRGLYPGAEDIFIGVGDNGLIVVDGDKHKRLRKLASPAFKLTTIKKIMPILEMSSKRMVDLFKLRCKEQKDNNKLVEVNVKEILAKSALDVIGLIAFGYDFQEALSFRTDTFGSDMRDSLDLQISLLCILPYQLPIKRFVMKIMKMLPLWFYKIFKANRAITRCHTIQNVHNLVDRMVKDKIMERQRSDWCESRSKTLLDFMMDLSGDVNKQEINDLLMTFLVAGHETTTVSLTWALYLLANHVEYQDKCRQEARQFFREHPSKVDWDSVKKLTWINAVVHETLRLYPPVPWIHKVSVNDDEIDGHFIPANTDTMLIFAHAHRLAEYWPNPYDFVPERFFETGTIAWDAFMPFGVDGPHKCIGYQLALTEMIYFLAVLLNNFEFSIDPNVEYHEFAVVTMQPKPELKLFVKPLNPL